MSSDFKKREGPQEARRKRRRKPSNARVPHYQTLSDIVAAVGGELRSLASQDGKTHMSRNERLYRLMIERALHGRAYDLRHVLRLMAKYPNIAVSREEAHYFISRTLFAVCGGGSNDEGSAPNS